MNCSRCGAQLTQHDVFCPQCGQSRGAAASGYTPYGAEGPVVQEPDGWFGHFLRYVGVAFMVGVSFWFIAGIFWMAHIFNRTGHRKRDLLWLIVPVVGAVVQTRALWRYTARNVYWTPHPERPSDVLRGAARPWAIAGGWILGPLMFGGLVALSIAQTGWTEEEREELVNVFELQGFDRPTAECIADEVIDEIPDADGFATDEEIDDAINDGIAICSGAGGSGTR